MQKELIRSSMRHMVFLEMEIGQLDTLISGLIQASQQQNPYELLQTIPGIKQEAAGNVLAETGADRQQFPDAAHLRADTPRTASVVPDHLDRVCLVGVAQKRHRLPDQ